MKSGFHGENFGHDIYVGSKKIGGNNMRREQKEFFNKAEQMLKEGIKKFKEDGESDVVSATLAHTALEKLFDNNELNYEFYKEVLEDLETIYITEPVRTYEVYQKYGVYEND